MASLQSPLRLRRLKTCPSWLCLRFLLTPALPSNQRLAIGLLLGVGAFTLYWVDQIVAPEVKEEEVIRPSSWGVRVVSRDR